MPMPFPCSQLHEKIQPSKWGDSGLLAEGMHDMGTPPHPTPAPPSSVHHRPGAIATGPGPLLAGFRGKELAEEAGESHWEVREAEACGSDYVGKKSTVSSTATVRQEPLCPDGEK